LRSLRREIAVGGPDGSEGVVTLTDEYAFSTRPASIEEAFMTWLEVDVAGPRATIQGERGVLYVEIEAPAGASFSLARLERESIANAKSDVLKRLTVNVPPDRNARFVVQASYKAQM
jgi:hypothetical protein